MNKPLGYVLFALSSLCFVALPAAADETPTCPAPEPQYKVIRGACLPSCGAAGGNACNDAAACAGRPRLKSYDCNVCCDRNAGSPSPAAPPQKKPTAPAPPAKAPAPPPAAPAPPPAAPPAPAPSSSGPKPGEFVPGQICLGSSEGVSVDRTGKAVIGVATCKIAIEKELKAQLCSKKPGQRITYEYNFADKTKGTADVPCPK